MGYLFLALLLLFRVSSLPLSSSLALFSLGYLLSCGLALSHSLSRSTRCLPLDLPSLSPHPICTRSLSPSLVQSMSLPALPTSRPLPLCPNLSVRDVCFCLNTLVSGCALWSCATYAFCISVQVSLSVFFARTTTGYAIHCPFRFLLILLYMFRPRCTTPLLSPGTM